MNAPPGPIPNGPGKLSEHLRFIYEELRKLQPIFAPGQTGARTTRGVVLNERQPAPQAAAAAGAAIVAEIITEGNDALLCSTDGGVTSFPVMKPHPLRVSRMMVYDGGVKMGDALALVSQTTSSGDFDEWGFVLRIQNKDFLPTVVEQDVTVWPQYLDFCTTTGLNLLRQNTFDTEILREVLVIKSTGCGKVDATDLRENILGDTSVDYMDITPGRTWRSLSELRQVQQVFDILGGTAIGTVDNEPLT